MNSIRRCRFPRQISPLRAFFALNTALGFSLFFSSPSACADSVRPPAEPRPCIGYNSVAHSWGSQWGNLLPVCDERSAFFSADNPMISGSHEQAPLWDTCCPLPSEDILLPIHVVVKQSCPEDFIVTGTVFADDKSQKSSWRGVLVHCTKLNVSRYQLGPALPGIFWGVGSELGVWNRTVPAAIMRSSIPPALRYSVGRRGLTEWDLSGCVGYPFGAVLVAPGRQYCSEFVFREISYRGLEGDPPAGSPVNMLPNCEGISDIFDPEARCSGTVATRKP